MVWGLLGFLGWGSLYKHKRITLGKMVRKKYIYTHQMFNNGMYALVGLYRYSRMAAEMQTTDIHMDLRIMRVKDIREAFDRFDMFFEEQRRKLLSSPIEIKIILDLGPKANVQVLTQMVSYLLVCSRLFLSQCLWGSDNSFL